MAEFDLEAGTLMMMAGFTSAVVSGGDYLNVGEERGSNFTEEV